MVRQLSDPAWKAGPKTREASSEHALDREPRGFDWDGFGVSEDEKTEGEPLVAIQEAYDCARDYCDETMRKRILFTTATLSDDDLEALHEAAEYEISEYVYENGERIDIETLRVPVVGGSITITAEAVDVGEPHGECYGHEEPDYDLDAYRYDL